MIEQFDKLTIKRSRSNIAIIDYNSMVSFFITTLSVLYAIIVFWSLMKNNRFFKYLNICTVKNMALNCSKTDKSSIYVGVKCSEFVFLMK